MKRAGWQQFVLLEPICQARAEGLEHDLPVRNKKNRVPTRRQVVLILAVAGRLLVRQRPPSGLLGGMWEFPCCELSGQDDVASVLAELQQHYRAEQTPEYLGVIKHVYSHFRLEADVFIARAGSTPGIAESGDSLWQSAKKLASGPLHGAHQKALDLVMKEQEE